jgi:signal transduction histidine kinase
VSLSATLDAAARALSYPLAQHGFELHVDMAEDVPEMNADADALEQAVLNLLTNAMKYSGDSRRIELRLARRGAEVVVEVTDYGVGIAPDQQAHIFEKYYRVPAPENQSIPGTGLGLTLVEQIAKAHGGRVAVESVPGQGSTFAIHLPIQERA